MSSFRLFLIFINTISTIFSIYASITALNRREKAGKMALYLSLSMAATTIYAFGYTMELASNTLTRILFWVKIEHLGIEFIAPFWLLFTLSLSGRQKLLTPPRIIGLFVIPTIIEILVHLNKFHLNPQLTPNAPFPTLSYTHGIVAWISISYIGICLVLSLIIFIAMYLKAVPTFRKQVLIFALGSIFPLIGMFITATHHALFNLDLAPLSLSISGILFVIGFRHLQILDIVPLARDVVFEGMGDGVLVFDTLNRLVDFNPQARNIFPEVKESSVGFRADEVFNAHPAFVKIILNNVNTTGTMQNGDLSYRCFTMSLYYPKDKLVGKVITIQDYTETAAMVKQLSDLATLDYLTGIYNRRYFYELAEKEISRSRRLKKQLSLILLDLDEFKLINDTLGHSAGDAVLKFVAQLFLERLRKYDIIGRFGGDEFLILLPETNISDAQNLAEELRGLLENSEIHFEDQIIKSTASFGVASFFLQQTAPFEDIVRRADKAVYIAKESGRNCVCVDHSDYPKDRD